MAFHTDSTDTLHALAELKRLELERNRFRNILDQAGEAIYIADPVTARFLDCNATACEMLGYSKPEILKLQVKDITQIHHVQSREAWNSFIEKLERQQTPTPVQSFHLRKDGTTFPVEVNVSLREYQGSKYLLAVARDITEKVKQEQLKLEFRRFRQVVDQAAEAIYIIEPETGRIVDCNAGAYEMVGYTKDELLKLTVGDIGQGSHLETPEAWAEQLRKLERTKESAQVYGKHIRKDGSEFPVECNISIQKYGGQPYLLAVARDITRRKQHEEQLKNALNEVEQLKNRLEEENIYLQQEIKLEHNFEEIICQSQVFKQVLAKVQQVAATDATVLVLGESGTGKELLVRAIHNISPRGNKPLVKVNCAALPANLIESELFGHEKGAFTGAHEQKKGRFELAHGGTIFLDEIGDLPLDLQTKLLRVLQEGEFERLGSGVTRKINVRVIAATNKDLEKAIEVRDFREDLFYRLNVFPITSPPLRERKEDIPILVEHFIRKLNPRLGKKVEEVASRSMMEMMEYHWPGNVRELENVIERALIICTGKTLRLSDWRPKSVMVADKSTTTSLAQNEKDHIIKVLKLTKGRVRGTGGAAKILDIHPNTLESRMQRLGIQKESLIQ